MLSLVLQVILLLLWYTVPAIAAVPAWIILLPTIIGGAVVGGALLIGLAALFLALRD